MKLNQRMKKYEHTHQHLLTSGVPIIVKVKGRFFNKLTLNSESLQDDFITAMLQSSLETIKEMEGFKLGYIHNDEVIFLITDYDMISTQSWFNYEISKIISTVSAKFNIEFNKRFKHKDKDVLFYTTCFNVPIEDVPNYFLWRQKDCQRNSLQEYCRQFFTQEQLNKVNMKHMKLMLNKIGRNWEDDICLPMTNGVVITYDLGIIKSNANIVFDYESLNNMIYNLTL